MLWFYELKKMINQKIIRLAIAACILLTIGLYAYVIQSNGYYDVKGTYQAGIKEAYTLSKERQTLNVTLQDTFIQNVVERYQTIVNTSANYNEQGDLDMALVPHEWYVYQPLFDLLVRGSSSLQSSDYHALQEKSPQDIQVQDIFLARNQQLQTITRMHSNNQPLYNRQERKIIEQAQTTTPSLHYEDATGWNLLFSKLSIINIALCIIGVLIGSTLFAREVHRGSASLIYTTRFGRTHGIFHKYLASIAFITILTCIIQGLFAVMIVSTYAFSGMHTMIQYQAMYWLSIFPFTNIEAYVFIIALGYLASLAMLFISMLCSRYARKEYHAVILSLLILFLPMVIAHKYNVFPYDMCNGNIQLVTITFYKLCSKSIYMYQAQILICVVLFAIPLFLYRSFQKRRLLVIS